MCQTLIGEEVSGAGEYISKTIAATQPDLERIHVLAQQGVSFGEAVRLLQKAA